MVEDDRGINREIDPRHLELLKLPLQIHNVPSHEIEDCLTTASLLGAMLKMGIGIRDTSENSIELTNPYIQGQDSGNLSTVSIEGSMRDETSEATADFFVGNVPAPSPLAISLPTESSSVIYTTNSENPKEGLLGLVIHSPDVRFRVELQDGSVEKVEITQIDQLEDQMCLIKDLNVSYKDGKPFAMHIAQSLAVEDPIYQKTRRVTRDVERLKSLLKMGTPSILTGQTKSMVRRRVAEIADLISAKLEGEELTELIGNIPNLSTEDFLRQIYQTSNQADRADEIINMVKEDMSYHKRHGLSATIALSGGDFSRVSINNLGKTTNLLGGWNETANEITGDQTEMWLNWLERIRERFDEDFDNIASVVSGRIQIDE